MCAKFEDSTLSRSKYMIGTSKILQWVTCPFHASLGVACHPVGYDLL